MTEKCDYVSVENGEPCGSDAIRFYLVPNANTVAARCRTHLLSLDGRIRTGWGVTWPPISWQEYLIRKIMSE